MDITINEYAKRNGYKKQTVYKRIDRLKKIHPDVEITITKGNRFLLTEAGTALLDKNFIENPVKSHPKTHTETHPVDTDAVPVNAYKNVETLEQDAISETLNDLDAISKEFAEPILSSSYRIQELEKQVSELNRHITDLEEKVTELTTDNIKLDKDNSGLKIKIEYLERIIEIKDKEIIRLDDSVKTVLNQNSELIQVTGRGQGLQALSYKENNSGSDNDNDNDRYEVEIIEPLKFDPDEVPPKETILTKILKRFL